MYKNIICPLLCFCLSLSTLSAQELGLHFMNNVWQSNLTNPAISPDQKIIFSFPSGYGNFAHSAIAFNDAIITTSEGVKKIDGARLVAGLEDRCREHISIEQWHSTCDLQA